MSSIADGGGLAAGGWSNLGNGVGNSSVTEGLGFSLGSGLSGTVKSNCELLRKLLPVVENGLCCCWTRGDVCCNELRDFERFGSLYCYGIKMDSCILLISIKLC